MTCYGIESSCLVHGDSSFNLPCSCKLQQAYCENFLTVQVQGGSRILFLDGGGVRGLIQIEVLSTLEKVTGQRIVDLFDWIIGTSTGGIVALGLVYGEQVNIPWSK